LVDLRPDLLTWRCTMLNPDPQKWNMETAECSCDRDWRSTCRLYRMVYSACIKRSAQRTVRRGSPYTCHRHRGCYGHQCASVYRAIQQCSCLSKDANTHCGAPLDHPQYRIFTLLLFHNIALLSLLILRVLSALIEQ
uniref:GDNF domain-containing protein n=1 Tax=Toxocara canis TaxID=6265 RepID=A0A183V6F2_TOXCA